MLNEWDYDPKPEKPDDYWLRCVKSWGTLDWNDGDYIEPLWFIDP